MVKITQSKKFKEFREFPGDRNGPGSNRNINSNALKA